MSSRAWGLACLLLFAARADAAFGTMQVFDNVLVTRVFSGTSVTYIQFSANLPGCNGPGGYLTPGWPDANGGVANEERNSQMVATALFAKATNTALEVRYRINSTGSGWDNCAIDAIYLH